MMNTRVMALQEKFAEVWRALGRPDTSRYIVLVTHHSLEWEYAEPTILGMPVFAVESCIHGCPIGIADPVEDITYIAKQFGEEWTKRGSWFEQ